MRTTLDIDDDVLAAAEEAARRSILTAAQYVSGLLRQGLTCMTGGRSAAKTGRRRSAGGFPALPSRGKVVSNELVSRLRDAEGV